MSSQLKAKYQCQWCDKTYVTNSGLWKHTKICPNKGKAPIRLEINDTPKQEIPKQEIQRIEIPKIQGNDAQKQDDVSIDGEKFSKFSSKMITDEIVTKKENIAAIWYGQKCSGKTTSIISILKNIIDNIDKVYVFSIAQDNKDRYHNELGIPYKQMMNGFDDANTEKFLRKLIQFQEITKNRTKVLLLFDDIIDAGNKLHGSGILDSLFANHRRYNISIFLSTQQPKKISPLLRQNVNYAFIHYTKNAGVRDILNSDYMSSMKKTDFNDMFEKVTEKYNILVIEPLKHDDYIHVYNAKWE